MKKIILLLIIFFCSSCNYRELNSLGLVSSMFIDYKQNKYIVYTEIINASKKSDSPSYFVKTSGKSLVDALNKISSTSDLKPFFSHMQVIVVSKNIIKDKLNNISDYLIRNEEIRKDHLLFICDDTKKLEKLKLHNKKTIGETIKDMYILSKNEYSRFRSSSFKQILNANLNKKYYYLGELTLNKNNIKLKDTFLMKNDKIIIKINKKYILSINLFDNNIKSFNMDNKNITYNVYSYKLYKKVKHNKLYIKIKCNLKVLSTDKVNIKTYKDLNKLEKNFNKYLTNYINKSYRYSKDLKIDIYNLNSVCPNCFNNPVIKVESMINEKGLTITNRGTL